MLNKNELLIKLEEARKVVKDIEDQLKECGLSLVAKDSRDPMYDVYIVELVDAIDNSVIDNDSCIIKSNGDYCIALSKVFGSLYRRQLKRALCLNIKDFGEVEYKNVRVGSKVIKADIFTLNQVRLMKSYVEYVMCLKESLF